MKWEEIYDKSKEIILRVVGLILEEETQEEMEDDKRIEDIVKCLQDYNFMNNELKKREHYNSMQAFRNMKKRERIRSQVRIIVILSSAACILAALCLVVFKGNVEKEKQTEIAMNSLMPVERMKATLLKADGDILELDERSMQIECVNGAKIVVDSSGLHYNVNVDLESDLMVYNTLIIPRGGMYRLTLADGTVVWLNSDSRLIYPVSFLGETREVILTGEAYFDVNRNETKPFVVTTDLGSVIVLGTQFNVKYYPDEASIITTLVDGSVSFSNGILSDMKLLPGEQLVYGEGDLEATVREVNVSNFIGWREHHFRFKGETLENIMRVLCRWYDVEVVFEDEGLKEIDFSGNLDKYEDIGMFLKLFELSTDVKFVRNNGVIYVERGINNSMKYKK